MPVYVKHYSLVIYLKFKISGLRKIGKTFQIVYISRFTVLLSSYIIATSRLYISYVTDFATSIM